MNVSPAVKIGLLLAFVYTFGATVAQADQQLNSTSKCFPATYKNKDLGKITVDAVGMPTLGFGLRVGQERWPLILMTRFNPTYRPNEYSARGVVRNEWALNQRCDYPMSVVAEIDPDCSYLELTVYVPSHFEYDCTYDPNFTNYAAGFERVAP